MRQLGKVRGYFIHGNVTLSPLGYISRINESVRTHWWWIRVNVIIYPAFVDITPEHGNDFYSDSLVNGLGLFAQGSAYHMVWVRGSKLQPMCQLRSCPFVSALLVLLHCNSRFICNKTCRVWLTKPAAFTLWPFPKELADPWGIALSTHPGSNDNLGKPTT